MKFYGSYVVIYKSKKNSLAWNLIVKVMFFLPADLIELVLPVLVSSDYLII